VGKIERLIRAYEDFVSLPWDQGLAGPQRVWFAVYDPEDERRLRVRITEFELATKRAGHGWLACDVTDAFPEWMSAQKYREEYFKEPESLGPALDDFMDWLAQRIEQSLSSVSESDVVALTGIAGLFGFLKVADLIRRVDSGIRGRLLVFFPGQYEDNNYRFLDARDGWNYLAVPITANSGD